MKRYILCLCLAIFAWGGPDFCMYAQRKDSPENNINAIDYRFQKFDNSPVVFSDSVKFRDRIYNVFTAGIEADWEESFGLNTPMAGFASRVGMGYLISPVHAVEAGLVYSNVGKKNVLGADLDWVMNLNNFATRKDGRSRFEVLYFAGASYRHLGKPSFGVNTGLRLQWNPGINAGLFIEPRLNVMTDPNSSRTFTTLPVVSFGLTLRYHKPKYYLWDYLTPFAIKTNLLYDAATAVNVAIEAPIRDHWSVVCEWVCPWWSKYSGQKYFQLMHGSMEGRYWFGNREDKPQLTGWFAGLSAGGGVYDVMLKADKGYQGDFQVYSVVGGYAHAINRSGTLRMEYELGLGWLGTEYVKYWWDGFDYTKYAPSPQTWRTNWFGPTKLQVSLVYMLKIRSKVGGRP